MAELPRLRILTLGMLAATGCYSWTGVRVHAFTRHGYDEINVDQAQVRLLTQGTNLCDEGGRFEITHWYRYWGLLTESDGTATFQINGCEKVAVAVTKPGFESVVVPVDSCEIERLQTKTFRFELVPSPAPPPAEGPGLVAMTFVEAFMHGPWSIARALAAPGSDLTTALDGAVQGDEQVAFGWRTYAAYGPIAQHVWTRQQGNHAFACVRLINSDGCGSSYQVGLAASAGNWKVDSFVGGSCDPEPRSPGRSQMSWPPGPPGRVVVNVAALPTSRAVFDSPRDTHAR
jgi:hypothetical protein